MRGRRPTTGVRRGHLKRRRKTPGFTLVELLVVIGIVGVLSGILFPTLVQVREAARKTSCTSNLRQLGAALQLYTSDWDDHWPGIWNGEWNTRVGTQLNWAAALQPYVANRRVYKCPSDPVDEVACSYNANLWLHNRTASTILAPSECVALMDGYTGEGEEYDPNEEYADPTSEQSVQQCSLYGLNADYTIWNVASRATRPDKGLPRHRCADNLLFADGHLHSSRALRQWGDPGALRALESALPFSITVYQTGGAWQNR